MKVYERFGDTQRGRLMELGSMLIVTLFVISYSLCVVMGIGRNSAMGRVDVGKWGTKCVVQDQSASQHS